MIRPAFSGLVLALLLPGCSTVSDAVRDRLESHEGESRSRTYTAPQRATYQAVRTAAEQMGYRVLRGGAAQGYMEAVSGIGRGESSRSARQITMNVTLRGTPGEATEVTVRLKEVIESDAGYKQGKVATQAPLQGTPQYEVFFRAVQQALDSVDNRQ